MAMIAPTNFTTDPEMQLYVYLSESTVKNFGFESNQVPLPHASELTLPRDWWSVWRCEVIIMDPDGAQNIVLFTNEGTLVSFICAGYSDDFDGMIQEFEAAFLTCLQVSGLNLPPTINTNVLPIVGEPEEFVDAMDWLEICATKDLVSGNYTPAEVQMRLYLNPACESGGESPRDYFLHELQAHPPLGFEIGGFDDVIPFPES